MNSSLSIANVVAQIAVSGTIVAGHVRARENQVVARLVQLGIEEQDVKDIIAIAEDHGVIARESGKYLAVTR